MDYIKFPDNKHRCGSALILVVVLTALLAVIGTIFLLSSRVDSMSTSSIVENKAIESAIDAIINKISDVLTNDVPGVSSDNKDYYDYPGPKDTWLASIEPYKNTSGDYVWGQITDLTGLLQNQDDPDMRFATRHVKVKPSGSTVIKEYPEIKLNADGSWLASGSTSDGLNGTEYRGQPADADGDGIADSKWIKLTDISTGKGKDIYAAIRIIDNGGMINVNTAYKLDPTVTFTAGGNEAKQVNGTTQSNIDLGQLARPGDYMGIGTVDPNDLNRERSEGANVYDDDYKRDILNRIEAPELGTFKNFQLFDMSEEADLRSRFCVSSENKGRLKTVWEKTLTIRKKTFDSSSGDGLSDWEKEVCRDTLADDEYDRRHMLTCWNMDRIINPVGGKMFGVNGRVLDNIGNYDKNYYTDLNNRQKLFNAIKAALDSTRTALNPTEYMGVKAAQIMVNLIDYIDTDLDMTVFDISTFDSNQPSALYYGFEGPCIYISEIAQKFKLPTNLGDPNLESYAIELYNPYASNTESIANSTDKWYIRIGKDDLREIVWTGTEKYHVLYNEDEPGLMESQIDTTASKEIYPVKFAGGDTIYLLRENTSTGLEKKIVDFVIVPKTTVWFQPDNIIHNLERDITIHKCIKEIWDPNPDAGFTATLGKNNVYTNSAQTPMQAHPANKVLDCIGDIGNVFAEDAYDSSKDSTKEENVKINFANPIYKNLFQYLTVFDPNNDYIDNDGDGYKDSFDQDCPEWKIAGRININTAPWFVLAQLPWVSKERIGAINYELSKAIVAYRDKIKIDSVDYSGAQGRHNKVESLLYGVTATNDVNEDVGFRSIGELNFVVDKTGGDRYSMWQYALNGVDPGDLNGYPDLTKIDTNKDGVIDEKDTGDDSADDFEERDVIFARISNLVTVRSDVFTAYILVRVGVDGPQQRAIAVLDRSNVYPKQGGGSTGSVKIKAFQLVPDIR